ncbi:hypothetical protein [Streptomyces microflavus]|uniref:hypothetical protein n=1 Tax=Streptomyces microflavus TaxID=1919 RepID=UPI002E337081|nr:hypothetical protein [Streptomyces microflavus]
MDPNVPIGRLMDTSQQRCTFSPGDVPENDCGRPASWDIAWNAALDTGFACNEHMAVALARFAFLDRHPIGPDCGMPNVLWDFEGKRCFYPREMNELTASEALVAPESG